MSFLMDFKQVAAIGAVRFCRAAQLIREVFVSASVPTQKKHPLVSCALTKFQAENRIDIEPLLNGISIQYVRVR
jgi:hypothetical protein